MAGVNGPGRFGGRKIWGLICLGESFLRSVVYLKLSSNERMVVRRLFLEWARVSNKDREEMTWKG